jgi:hypothetical protein
MEEKNDIKMYFRGDSGIKTPVDLEGNSISVGDILTCDYADYEKNGIEITERHKTEPFYIVKINDKGGYYAESIKACTATISESYFYLHDFRFKYCKLISKKDI